MKKIIITTFILGLSTGVYANDENLDQLYSFGTDDVQTTGSQPQVGSSRDSHDMGMMDDGNSFSWYDVKDGN